MKPEISIILPFFNDEKTLGNSIESMLEQDFENFELILVDNNSTDKSIEVAKEFGSKDKRIKIVEEPNQGIANALNKGIENSSGKYIARMDADDISYENRLSRQYTFLEENPKYDLVACKAFYNGDEELQTGFLDYVKWNNKLITHEDIWGDRFVEAPVIHPTVMFKSELIAKHGGYIQGDFPEDYELWLRWLSRGVFFHKLPEILHEWIDSEERLTRTDARYSQKALYETKSTYLYEFLKEYNKFHPQVAVWGAGKTSRQKFSILNELGVTAKFYIDVRANPTYNVIEYNHLSPAGNNYILSYVSNREGRQRIKEFLMSLGYREGHDFICVA